MPKTRRIILFLIAALLVPPAAAGAASVDVLSGKMLLESQMEGRLKKTLSSYLATDAVTVVVRLTLVDRNEAAAAGGGVRKWDENEELVLPGVPAATSMTKKAKTEDGAKDLSRLGLSNISVSVIVGKRLNKDEKVRVWQLASDTLGLDTQAGDTLNVESAGPSAAFIRPPSAGEVIALLGLALFVVFLFGPFKAFLKKLNENLTIIVSQRKAEESMPEEEEDIPSRKEEALRPAPVAGAAPVADEYTDQSPVIEEENLTLGRYVNKGNLEDLKLVLQSETPEVIAKIIQRLPPKTGLAAVPRDKLNEVIAQFTAIEFENPAMVKLIMDRIKEKMLGSFGGAQRLGRILQIMDKPGQESVLAYLKAKDPAFAASVERKLFRFEDLLLYEDGALKRIFRKAGADAFARCLKNCPEETAGAFFGKLGPSIKNLIENRLKTLAVTGKDNDSENALLAAVEDLSRKGFVPPIEDLKQNKA